MRHVPLTQSHLTLGFSLQPETDTAELVAELERAMPLLYKAADELGTVHYARFTLLSRKTLLFLSDFDGAFAQLMISLATTAGSVFDTILAHVVGAPPTPVTGNAATFAAWADGQLVRPINLYTAYPDATAKQIKGLASAAGVTGASEQRPFLVVLPTRSRFSFAILQLIMRARGSQLSKDLDSVGTPHFAQFVPLEDNQIGFFTVYDGDFDTYIADFTKNIGNVFDLIFKFTKNPPPSPCRKHLQEFIDFAAGASRAPIGFYQAYPGLTCQDIRALISDSRSPAAAAE
jgi:hypothetical protein